MTLMFSLLLACGPTSESTSDYVETTPRIAIQNDATETVTVSVLALDGLEVWFDDVAAGTATALTDFDATDLAAAVITVHAGTAQGGDLDLDYGNNTIVLSDDAAPELDETETGGGGGSGSDGDDGGGGGWGW
jgi:hypothetical protein